MLLSCPLCEAGDLLPFHEDKHRSYIRCRTCQLVFVPPAFFLSPEEEQAHYDLHENDPADQRYRTFLSRLCTPLLKRLAPHSSGLDFGSGPGPTLSVMLQEAGHRVALYDRFYADDPSVFEQQYDFITASEVVEHLHHPGSELKRLWNRLRPGGVLGIMTKLVADQQAFRSWHYIRDPTHVCFFSTATWGWLAAEWGAEHEQIGADITLLRKTDGNAFVH